MRLVNRLRSAPRSSAMRDHSRNSMTTGSAMASCRKQRGSVRKDEAITSASRLSSLAPARVKRSRKRSICFGLIECTLKPRSISVSTTGPWDLDSDLNLRRLARATLCHQPGRHRGESFATVLEYPLSDFLAAAVGEEYVVAFRSPVDARIPLFLICHAFSLFSHASHRDLRRSLYWRSEVNRRLRRELPTGHRSRPIRRGTCPTQVVGPQGAIGCSRRIGSVLEGYAISGRRPRVTLRSATLHFA